MRRPSLAVLCGLIVLPLARPVVAAEEETSSLPILQTSIATLVAGGRVLPLAYSVTAAGPLFAVHPFLRLGGELELGPLRHKHSLTVGETTFVFGPGSEAVTRGEEIFQLSQAPLPSPEGLQAPLDLLRLIYGDLLGYRFRWMEGERRLEVARRQLRELAVGVDLAHFQGVTTVVLTFPERPRHRIATEPGEVRVEMLGDRLRSSGEQPRRTESLVRRIDLEPEAIRIALAAGAETRSYELSDPYRLVFDVFRGAAPRPQTAGSVVPRRERPGVQTVVIDPGHGGSDTGAIGPGGTQEKDLTLSMARVLKRSLEARMPVRVVLTRSEDAELPLETRAALANQHQADLFLSLHLNSSYGVTARGAETYFLSLEASDERARQAAEDANRAAGQRKGPLSDLQLILWDLAQVRYLAASQSLAALIQEEFNQALGLHDRGVKQAPFAVLMGAAMPAVLVEAGFLSNPEEERRLLSPEYQRSLMNAVVRAVSRFRAQGQTASFSDPEEIE